MLIKPGGGGETRASEITPRELYLDRRRFMAATAGVAVAALVPGTRAQAAAEQGTGQPLTAARNAAFSTDEVATPWEAVTTYNNFYEFGLDKDDPARRAGSLKTRPWTIRIDGMVAKPGVIDIEALLKEPLEERVYRLRCVEAWSMVVPWIGFPFSRLIDRVEPLGSAKFVAFETLYDPEEMPGQKIPILKWPYVEGLRLDEARHPLTIVGLGLYGQVLPNQNGAPVRVIVPWKYGFKSIKSIVSMRFTEEQPPTSWSRTAPDEYGFYANVNPAVDHPRWSQKRERRIGEFRRRETLPFNGYGEQVAALYAGMDLNRYY